MSITVDVVIPAYNPKQYLDVALESIAKQTYLPKTVVVVDDGSVAPEAQYIDTLLEKNWPFQLRVLHQANQGPNAARNLGIRQCAADWIALCDADDFWEPEKLEAQVHLISTSKFKNLGLVYCDYQNVDEFGRIRDDLYKVPFDDRVVGNCVEVLLRGNFVLSSCSGVLIYSKCFKEVGYFREDLRFGEDWEMWVRISEKFELDRVKKVLVNIRRHDANSTENKEIAFLGDLRVLELFSSQFALRYPEVLRMTVANFLKNAPGVLLLYRAINLNFVKQYHFGLREIFKFYLRTALRLLMRKY